MDGWMFVVDIIISTKNHKLCDMTPFLQLNIVTVSQRTFIGTYRHSCRADYTWAAVWRRILALTVILRADWALVHVAWLSLTLPIKPFSRFLSFEALNIVSVCVNTDNVLWRNVHRWYLSCFSKMLRGRHLGIVSKLTHPMDFVNPWLWSSTEIHSALHCCIYIMTTL